MQIIPEDNHNSIARSVALAVDFLCAGKAIIFATDTVYGIAVDASNTKAVEYIYKLKNRDKKKPIAIFLPNIETAEKIFIFSKKAKEIAQKFSQESLTLVLKKQPDPLINLAKNLNENDDFLGFRIVEKKFIRELLQTFGGVLAVTSANISGASSAISADEVKKYFNFDDSVLLIDGGTCQEKIPSAVIKIDGEVATILRHGKKPIFI